MVEEEPEDRMESVTSFKNEFVKEKQVRDSELLNSTRKKTS